MKTLYSPDQAPVPAVSGGGGGGGPAVASVGGSDTPSRDVSGVIDAIQCEFHDYPRAAIVDAMESCLLELEGAVEEEDLKTCMRHRLRGNDRVATH